MGLFDDDKENKCGWKWLTLFKDPKKDPYIDACTWHDNATSKGSWAEKNIPLDKVQKTFERQLDELDKNAGRPINGLLSRFYKFVTRKVSFLFWDGKK